MSLSQSRSIWTTLLEEYAAAAPFGYQRLVPEPCDVRAPSACWIRKNSRRSCAKAGEPCGSKPPL